MLPRMMMRLCRRHLSSVDFATKSEVKSLASKIDSLISMVETNNLALENRLSGMDDKLGAVKIMQEKQAEETEVLKSMQERQAEETRALKAMQVKQADETRAIKIMLDRQAEDTEVIKMMQVKQAGESKALKIMIGNVASGLGIQFEKFNLSWLKRFLQSKGISMDKVESNRTEYNLEGVADVEIDIYSHNPPLIMECSSFIDKNEIRKVERLALVRRALEKRHNVRFECLLSHMGIHKDIRKQVARICKEENIELIGDYELPEE